MLMILKPKKHIFFKLHQINLRALCFISQSLMTKLTMQPATPTVGKTRSKNATLMHSCQLTPGQWNTAHLTLENAPQSFIKKMLGNQKPTPNELNVAKRAIIRCLQDEIKYFIFITPSVSTYFRNKCQRGINKQ